MTMEELEEDGILLPRDQWGKRELKSRVAKVPLLVIAGAALGSVGMMYLGNGRGLTWMGLGVFFASLTAFTAVSLSGIR